ncbi:MAG: flavodoxin family protein, partial [Candidatus Lokiarchaeota archaeon]
DSAEEFGAETEKILLKDLNINPCQACDSCYKTGKCFQNDDMELLLEKMEKSKIWILGTPIYWWGPTAQFKAFLDRWYLPKHRQFKGKKVVLVIPLGGGSERYARHTVGLMKDVVNYLSMELFEILLAPGFNKRGEVHRNESLLKKARNIGKKLMSS